MTVKAVFTLLSELIPSVALPINKNPTKKLSSHPAVLLGLHSHPTPILPPINIPIHFPILIFPLYSYIHSLYSCSHRWSLWSSLMMSRSELQSSPYLIHKGQTGTRKEGSSSPRETHLTCSRSKLFMFAHLKRSTTFSWRSLLFTQWDSQPQTRKQWITQPTQKEIKVFYTHKLIAYTGCWTDFDVLGMLSINTEAIWLHEAILLFLCRRDQDHSFIHMTEWKFNHSIKSNASETQVYSLHPHPQCFTGLKNMEKRHLGVFAH